MPLHVSSTTAHLQEAKIVLYSLWYHHTYMWPFRAQIERGINLCTGRPSIGVMRQETVYIVLFWPPDDEHVCSKHVEA